MRGFYGDITVWFKNLRVYRLTKPFSETSDSLESMMESFVFTPCGSQDTVKMGWVPALGRNSQQLVHAANNCLLICAKRQEKVLPAAVINEQMEEKVQSIQAKEGRHVSRRERQTLKEDIQQTLLPKAFAKSQHTFAYISVKESLIVIDSSSAKRAEDVLNLLREAIGSLPVIPLSCKNIPTQTMTNWLAASEAPNNFVLGEECELEAPKDEGRIIRCKHQDLSAPEFLKHLETQMFVRKLAVTWNEAIECVLDHELAIKRVKFADSITDKLADRNPETAAEEMDQTFAIMTLEISAFIKQLIEAFGGPTAIEA